jgi:hypothetical protein
MYKKFNLPENERSKLVEACIPAPIPYLQVFSLLATIFCFPGYCGAKVALNVEMWKS